MKGAFRVLLVALLLGSSTHVSTVVAEQGVSIPGTESISAVFSAGSRIVAFDPRQHSLRLYAWQSSALREERSLAIQDNVSAVATLPDGYAVATGMGIDAPTAPMRVFFFSINGATGRVVFERAGERNQITSLRWNGEKLWISFFSSKYLTTIGYLTPTAGGPWSFTETASIRMGDSLDVVGDLVFVGRSYGDIQGQDGDLLLLTGGNRTVLPSYRGVRSVRVVGDVSNHQVYIGDGWHMNYGQLAQGRLSVLSRRPGDLRYSLQILDYDAETTEFRKLLPFHSSGRDYIGAVGSSSVIIYDQRGAVAKRVLYRQASSDKFLDGAVIQVSPEKALVVIADHGLQAYEL